MLVEKAESNTRKITSKKRRENKQEHKLVQLVVSLKMFRELSPPEAVVFDEFGLLVPYQPENTNETILGEIKPNYERFIGKVTQVKVNTQLGVLSARQEPRALRFCCNKALIERFESFKIKEAPISLEIIKSSASLSQLWSQININIFLFRDDWLEKLMGSETLPCSIIRVDRSGNDMSISYHFNFNYIKLSGVSPQVFADVTLQQSAVPNIIQENDLFLWSQRMINFKNTQGGFTRNEFDTIITTFEGTQVPVSVQQYYYQATCIKTQKHILIQKNCFKIKQPLLSRNLCNVNRIQNNSMKYARENHIKEINKNFFEELNGIEEIGLRRCGFKLIES